MLFMMSGYELPVFILKIITVILILALIHYQKERYYQFYTQNRKHFLLFLLFYLLSFVSLIVNQLFLFEIRGLGTASSIIFNSIGNYYLAHFSFELFLERNYAQRKSVRLFFMVFFIIAITSGISSAIFSWEYYGYAVRNIIVPSYTIILLLSTTLLNLDVYGFLFIQFFRDFRTFNRLNPQDREKYGDRIANVSPRYRIMISVCIFHFIAVLLLLVDIYLDSFTIYALIGWIFYVIGFSLLLIYFGIKKLLPTVEPIGHEDKN